MKIIICGNKSSNILTFRMDLIKLLISKRHSVVVLCADDKYYDCIVASGCKCIITKFDNRSINPFSFIKLKRTYIKIFKSEKPDVVFTSMLKPNIFGTIAAKKSGVKRIIALNEGRGDAFGYGGILGLAKKIMANHFHRVAFKNIDKVIVLNSTDLNYFLKKRICKGNQICKIPGVGVDENYFYYCPEISRDKKVLMISRLIKNKGIFDFCKIAEIIKKQRPEICFELIGAEQTISISDLKYYLDKNIVNYIGEVKDVREFIRTSRILVLPSVYNEGFGLVLAEAMSMGRCPIAYKNFGPSEVIDDGINGFLIEPRRYEDIAKSILNIIDNETALQEIGKFGRIKAETRFSRKSIDDILLKIIEGRN